jgi:hypothetical protein
VQAEYAAIAVAGSITQTVRRMACCRTTLRDRKTASSVASSDG